MSIAFYFFIFFKYFCLNTFAFKIKLIERNTIVTRILATFELSSYPLSCLSHLLRDKIETFVYNVGHHYRYA